MEANLRLTSNQETDKSFLNLGNLSLTRYLNEYNIGNTLYIYMSFQISIVLRSDTKFTLRPLQHRARLHNKRWKCIIWIKRSHPEGSSAQKTKYVCGTFCMPKKILTPLFRELSAVWYLLSAEVSCLCKMDSLPAWSSPVQAVRQ